MDWRRPPRESPVRTRRFSRRSSPIHTSRMTYGLATTAARIAEFVQAILAAVVANPYVMRDVPALLFLGGAPSSGKGGYVNRAFVSPMLSGRPAHEWRRSN